MDQARELALAVIETVKKHRDIVNSNKSLQIVKLAPLPKLPTKEELWNYKSKDLLLLVALCNLYLQSTVAPATIHVQSSDKMLEAVIAILDRDII